MFRFSDEAGGVDRGVIGWELAKASDPAGEQFACAGSVAGSQVVQRDGELDQALGELSFRLWLVFPQLLEHFVAFEEFALVKQVDPASE
jgi:hypothetical protein